jgi:hypothetical protein
MATSVALPWQGGVPTRERCLCLHLLGCGPGRPDCLLTGGASKSLHRLQLSFAVAFSARELGYLLATEAEATRDLG